MEAQGGMIDEEILESDCPVCENPIGNHTHKDYLRCLFEATGETDRLEDI